MSTFAPDQPVVLTATGQRGIVVQTRGTMYNDTAVLVVWDDQNLGAIAVTYQGATLFGSWEDPGQLSPYT